jgi:transcriptional regulator with XRE-family HTH domain
MSKRFRSRKEELVDLRTRLRVSGASTREIAHAIRTRFKVNSRVAYRNAHGLTQQQVADLWNELWPPSEGQPTITHKHVSYWESWPGPSGRSPSPEVLNRLAKIYHTSAAELLDGEDHTEIDSYSPRTSTSAVSVTGRSTPADVLGRVDAAIAQSGSPLTGESDYQHLVEELVEWARRMRRRDVLQWLSWAAAAAAAAPVLDGLDDNERERTALALISPRRVDHQVVDHIEDVLWRCMRQDDSLGPQAALDTVLAQRALVRGLIPEVQDHLKESLLSLLANLSRFAGWLSFDLNNHTAAADYYETARATAHEAHNTELGAFVLCNMSHLASWRGQARIGIDHALAAQGWATQTDDSRLQAYAHDVAARGLAMDGQAHAADTALERARIAMTRAETDSKQDTLVYFFNAGQLDSTESSCHFWLGRHDRSADLAERALTSIDDAFVRNQALTLIRLGVCHLRAEQRDVGRGARRIKEAAVLAAHNRSPRLTERLHRGAAQLEPWRNQPEVREVFDLLASNGRAYEGTKSRS